MRQLLNLLFSTRLMGILLLVFAFSMATGTYTTAKAQAMISQSS